MDFTFDDDNNIVIASQSGVYTKCGGVLSSIFLEFFAQINILNIDFKKQL